MDDNIFGPSKKEAMDYVVNGVTKVIIGLTIVIATFLLLNEEETHTKVGNKWKNADFSKPASAVKSLDYENNYDAIKGCLNLLPSNGLFDNQN